MMGYGSIVYYKVGSLCLKSGVGMFLCMGLSTMAMNIDVFLNGRLEL